MKQVKKAGPGGRRGEAAAPRAVFKKPRAGGRLRLPAQLALDDNIVSKTKFDKTLTKKNKVRLEKPTEILKAAETGNIKGIKTKKAKLIPEAPFQMHEVAEEGKKKKPKVKTYTKATVKSAPLEKTVTKTAKMALPKQSIKKTKPDKSISGAVVTKSVPEVPKAAKSSKKILPSKYVTAELVTKAVKALQQLATQQKNKNKMFEDEANVFAQIMCIKIQNKTGNIRFTLPHSTVATTGEVCLITPDLIKGKKPDHEPTIDHWQEVLRNAGVTQIKTVLPMRQLRVEYDQYELKRRLLTQHDFIMVDSRVLNHVSHILGKNFFKKHNMLISVRLHNVKDIKKSIEKSLKTAMLRLNEGATSTILVGHMGMSLKEIRENILALVQQMGNKFPGGEHNIRSLSIKLPLSLALPLYVTLRSKKTVQAPRLHTVLPKQHRTIEGELSTIPGSTVKVTPEGTVILKRGVQGEDLIESDEEEQNEKEEVEEKPRKKLKTNPVQEKSSSHNISLASSGSSGGATSDDSDASEAGNASGSEEEINSDNDAEEATGSVNASGSESDDDSE